jgi:acyl carrier protein
MTREQIITRVNEILVDEFEVDQNDIAAEANLRETLDLDSLDYVDLVVIIESNFGFKVVAEDFISIHTFGDFYSYVERKVAEKANA